MVNEEMRSENRAPEEKAIQARSGGLMLCLILLLEAAGLLGFILSLVFNGALRYAFGLFLRLPPFWRRRLCWAA